MPLLVFDYLNLSKTWSRLVPWLSRLEVVEMICICRTNALMEDGKTYMFNGVGHQTTDYLIHRQGYFLTDHQPGYDRLYAWPSRKLHLHDLVHMLADAGRADCRVYLMTQYGFHHRSRSTSRSSTVVSPTVLKSIYPHQLYHLESVWYRIHAQPPRAERIATSLGPPDSTTHREIVSLKDLIHIGNESSRCEVCQKSGHTQVWCWAVHPDLKPLKKGWTKTAKYWRDERHFSLARNPVEYV